MSDAEGNIEQLQMLNRVLFDRASRPEYGAISQLWKTQGTLEAQVSDRVVETVGLFKMGASFGADGNLLASDSTFFNLVRDRYLLIMLMQEALILAALGFIPGFLISLGLYQVSYAATLLEIAMKSSRAVIVLFLTILMCGTSGAIAMRKLQSADPADIF